MKILLLSYLVIRSVVVAAESDRPLGDISGDDASQASPGRDLTRYVDVFIGTGSTGNTFPGATVPFGMVQFSPMMDKPSKSWNWNSGYHRDKNVHASRVLGFGLTALSGTGLNAGGDFIFLPGVAWAGSAMGKTAKLIHQSEQASPGLYRTSVEIPSSVRSKAAVELTAGNRTGMMRVKYDSEVQGQLEHTLLLNLASPQDIFETALVEQTGPTQLNAMRSAKPAHHCGAAHSAFAAIDLNVPVSSVTKVNHGTWQLTFEQPIQELVARIGLSYVDREGAWNNLQHELGDSWDLDAMSEDARQTWNAALARAQASGSEDLMRRYYTALYHTMLGPTLFSDADRRYRPGGSAVKVARDFDFYSTFSLWDTYRAEHPLLNLLFPEMAPHFVKSLLAIQKDKGQLPRWVLYGEDTQCMVGYPAVNVISEAALKGLLRPQVQATVLAEGFAARDLEKEAFNATINTSRHPEDGSDIDNLVAISAGITEGMSKALEYAWSDSCISRLAGKLGETTVKEHYLNRSRLYRTYFHKKTKMLLPRHQNTFIELKENKVDESSTRFYVEGSPLQYNFMVPHDMPGFIELLGSQAALEKRLDEYFSGKFEDESPDFTGLHAKDLATGHFGGHVQGNEPGHHIPYMYNSAGVPWKTQETVDQLMTMYTADHSGLPGNDDVGQMSAWFVFSALGFYPVDPCSSNYAIGRPLVDRATLKLQHGKLNINVTNQAPLNKYVTAMSWKGSPLSGTDLQHDSIVNGGELLFELGSNKADFREQMPHIAGSKNVQSSLHVGGDKKLMRRQARKNGQKDTGLALVPEMEVEARQ